MRPTFCAIILCEVSHLCCLSCLSFNSSIGGMKWLLSWLSLMVDWRFSRGVVKQTEAVHKGMHEVLEPRWLQLFDERELEVSPCTVSLENMRNSSTVCFHKLTFVCLSKLISSWKLCSGNSAVVPMRHNVSYCKYLLLIPPRVFPEMRIPTIWFSQIPPNSISVVVCAHPTYTVNFRGKSSLGTEIDHIVEHVSRFPNRY